MHMQKWTHVAITLTTVACAGFLSACAGPETNDGSGGGSDGSEVESERTGTAAEAIENGVLANDFYSMRAVKVRTNRGFSDDRSCTGTIISPRHVLTAAHCRPYPHMDLPNTSDYLGTAVAFFGTENTPSGFATVTQVQFAPGVDPFDDDLYDSNGDFADYAVLTLSSTIPSSALVADLYHQPVNAGTQGTLVGRGSHADNPSLAGYLLSTTGTTMCYLNVCTGIDWEGDFSLTSHLTDPGDSGGPFYNGLYVAGVLYGQFFYSLGASGYTSTSHHLSRILDMIGYQTTIPGYSNLGINGSRMSWSEFITADRDACAYACERDGICKGYVHFGLSCMLYSNITGYYSFPGTMSGVK